MFLNTRQKPYSKCHQQLQTAHRQELFTHKKKQSKACKQCQLTQFPNINRCVTVNKKLTSQKAIE